MAVEDNGSTMGTGRAKRTRGRWEYPSNSPAFLLSTARWLRNTGPWAAMASVFLGAAIIVLQALQKGLKGVAEYTDNDDDEGGQ